MTYPQFFLIAIFLLIIKLFSLFVSAIVEPTSYNQAVKFKEWREAMDNEIKALELNNTWSIVDLLASKHAGSI